ncbi:MAG: branched-chain amino acid ABC transporter permease [Pseudomonadota bacterium]
MTMATRENGTNVAVAGILASIVVYALLADEPFLITLATRVVIFAIAAVGLNLALGYGGLVSFGHAAFFGIGGFAAGILASHAQDYTAVFESPFLLEGTNQMLIIWPVALVAAALAALAIGALSLRTSGVYFIMITLAFAQMIYYFAISWPRYGGEDGLSIYTRNAFPGADPYSNLHFFLIAVLALAISMLVVWRITNARFGLALQAARQNPGRVSAAGIKPYNVRLTAFVLSAMITGLAGALYVDLIKFVSPAMMSWHISGEIMIIVILGGVGRLFGPLAGALMFVFMEHWLGTSLKEVLPREGAFWDFIQGFLEHWRILLGLTLLAVVLFAKGGIIGILAGGGRGHG